MSVVTKFRSESVNGYGIDVLKSALQKGVRRGDKNTCVYVLTLVNKFVGIEKGEKIVSNFLNRLIVMMSEEISINYWYLPVIFKEIHEEYLKTKNYTLLFKMLEEILNCKKCRLISDLKTVYNLPPYYLKDSKKLDELYAKLLDEFGCASYNVLCKNEKECLIHIEDMLRKSVYVVFGYISWYLKDSKKVAEIWKILYNICKGRKIMEVIKSLKYFYGKMTHKEKPIYMYHAVLLLLHENEVICIERENCSIVKLDATAVESFEFPDWVYDIHTRDGRLRGKNRNDFASDGSVVVDECETFKNLTYRKMYIRFKEIIEDKPDNSIAAELMKPHVIRGQKQTSPSKNHVYFPLEGRLKGYAWKGPFKADEKRCVMLDYRVAMFKLMNSDVNLPEKVIDGNDIWYKFPMLGHIEKIDYETFGSLKILKRESLDQVQLHKLTDKQMIMYLFEKGMIKTFLDAAIVGVGDVGPWNTLVFEEKCWLIDFEDTSAKIKYEKLGDLFSKSCKRYEKILSCYVDYKNELLLHMNKRREQVKEMIEISERHNRIKEYLNFDPLLRIDELSKVIEK